MDTLSRIRKHLQSIDDKPFWPAQTRSYVHDVFLVRRNRRRLAELLCAVLSDALGGTYGLGQGAQWRTQGQELMADMLALPLEPTLLSDEEKARGIQAANGPHTSLSLLTLLAATAAALQGRRDRRALQYMQIAA